MTKHRRFFMIVAGAVVLATFNPSQAARAGPISSFLLTHPGIICDLPPSEVTFEPVTLATATQINYTFLVNATRNGTSFAAAGSSVPASLFFSPAPGGSTGLVPGTAVAVPGTNLIDQRVDVDFNIVGQTGNGPVILLAGELKGILAIDTSIRTGTISLEPVPSPWISDLVYAGNPALLGVGIPFSLAQVATLDGGPLGITPTGNISPFSADIAGQFSTVPEPTSLAMGGLGLIVVATASLVRRRLAKP